jgi:hypothetical protein
VNHNRGDMSKKGTGKSSPKQTSEVVMVAGICDEHIGAWLCANRIGPDRIRADTSHSSYVLQHIHRLPHRLSDPVRYRGKEQLGVPGDSGLDLG